MVKIIANDNLSDLNKKVLNELGKNDIVVQIDSKRTNSTGTKNDLLAIPDEFQYPKEHDDIVKMSNETQFGHELKAVTGTIIYSFGNQSNSPEKELNLSVELDYEKGHSIKIFGTNFFKQDFLTLYNSFGSIKDNFLVEMWKVIETKKESFKDQMDMFPELNKSSLSFMEITLPIYSQFEGDEVSLKLQICGHNSDNLKIKVNKKVTVNECDLWFLYSKFDQIIDYIVGENK